MLFVKLAVIAFISLLAIPQGVTAQDSTIARSVHSDLTYYVDENGQRQQVQNVADWQIRRTQIITGMEAAMGPLPERSDLPPLGMKLIETDNSLEIRAKGYRRETISFESGDGDRIPADLYFPVPLPADAKVPGILALHPTGPLGKRIIAGEGPLTNRQYAVELAQRGYIVIAPDYPSFGDYQDYDFLNDRYVSGTMKGIFNHMRCVDLLTTALDQVDPERIGVIGHSLGGHNAMFVAAFDERIDVIVSSCGWTPFHDYYDGDIKGWTSERYMPLLKDKYQLDPDQVPFDFYEILGALAPRPFFSSSPKDDANFAVAGVKKAIPRALGVYTHFDAAENLQVRYPDCEHDFPTETRVEAYRFIDHALGHKPTREVDFSAELPRIAGKSPDEALATFEVAPGFQLEQTAAEPFIHDPVAMSFDENGWLYVVEMKDYSEQETERLGRVRLLKDTNQDGKFDESFVFADDLSWPTAIICSQGGVFVGAAPHIYFLKDNDGDTKAEEQRIVFTGFERTNVQGLLNSFQWGPDNRIHGATSSSGGIVRRADDPHDPGVDLRRQDFSFDPLKLDLRAVSGGGQHGMCFDDWGRKYVCSNSDHAQMVMYSDRDLARNPELQAPGPRIRIADDGGQAPVFRTSQIEPWRIVRTRLRVSGQVGGPVEGGGKPAGYFTGATGVTVYRGDAWGEDQKGVLIVGDVGSNIVHRKIVKPDGASFVASRIDQSSEFVRSTDVWFRPVQFANGPDGCLHILDMYRETIEHPKSLPPEIKQHLDLTSGRDRGRLYRVMPVAISRKVELGKMTHRELVPLLDHTNSWHRETASRLLYERQAVEIVHDLVELVRSAQTPYGKIHAAGLLLSFDNLQANVLAELLKDGNPRVREVAVRLARQRGDVKELSEQLKGLVDDPDPRVRYELALTAGELNVRERVPILTEVLARDGGDPWIMLAALSSLSEGLPDVFTNLLAKEDLRTRHETRQILAQVLAQICVQEDKPQILKSLEQLTELRDEFNELKSSLLRAAIKAKPELRQELRSAELISLVDSLTAAAEAIAFDEHLEPIQRSAAIHDLTFSSDPSTPDRLLALLENSAANAIQSAALETAVELAYEKTVTAIVQNWAELSPAIRSQAEEIVFSRSSGIDTVFSAIAGGQLKLATITRSRIESIANSRDPEHKSQAKQILMSSQTPSRAAVVEHYQSALSKQGNPGLGRQVFLKNCSICHQLDGAGTEIGPNLATMKNRGAETILLNVLDPNREVNPQYVNYVVAMQSGKSHTGIIAEETPRNITLLRAEKKTDVLDRSEIEELHSTGLSIMPEGLEKEISVEQMSDLLAYLLSIQ